MVHASHHGPLLCNPKINAKTNDTAIVMDSERRNKLGGFIQHIQAFFVLWGAARINQVPPPKHITQCNLKASIHPKNHPQPEHDACLCRVPRDPMNAMLKATRGFPICRTRTTYSTHVERQLL